MRIPFDQSQLPPPSTPIYSSASPNMPCGQNMMLVHDANELSSNSQHETKEEEEPLHNENFISTDSTANHAHIVHAPMPHGQIFSLLLLLLTNSVKTDNQRPWHFKTSRHLVQALHTQCMWHLVPYTMHIGECVDITIQHR